jgi:hypothetical protein
MNEIFTLSSIRMLSAGFMIALGLVSMGCFGDGPWVKANPTAFAFSGLLLAAASISSFLALVTVSSIEEKHTEASKRLLSKDQALLEVEKGLNSVTEKLGNAQTAQITNQNFEQAAESMKSRIEIVKAESKYTAYLALSSESAIVRFGECLWSALVLSLFAVVNVIWVILLGPLFPVNLAFPPLYS